MVDLPRSVSWRLVRDFDLNVLVYLIYFVFSVQFVKCGFAGDNFPAAVFPCLVGRPMLRYEENLGEQQLTVISLDFQYK